MRGLPALLIVPLAALASSAGCMISPCTGQVFGDLDGDGLADAVDREADGDSWRPDQGDCDDCDPSVGPNVPDLEADGVDQDCDGVDGG